ncbi:MAG: hypothetical protein H6993_07345 [Pseudomonadales bacterium]|nr:hypothetical protein [Pseudomonadales bacterium]MCP5183760.1 hypothetical protein [Pseudomonadales bacterium]
MTQRDNYSNVKGVDIDPGKRADLYNAQTECVVNWTTRDGWPVGVMHRFVWHDDRFWVTCAPQRVRVRALRERPQSSVIVSSEGTWLGGDLTTTAKTLASVHDDQAIRDWFYPALARRQRKTPEDQAEFIRRLDTPGRVVIELTPVAWITYDGVRLESSLRGIPYNPCARKPSRNQTEPPDGRTMVEL